MNSSIKTALVGLVGLIAGAAGGYFVGSFLMKRHYEQHIDEELQSVRDEFANQLVVLNDKIKNDDISEVVKDDKKNEVPNANGSTVNDYRFIVDSINKKVDVKDEESEPTLIDEVEFGEDFSYEEVTLFYYDDKILADDELNIIDEPEFIIGDALNRFKDDEELEDVYVKNEKTKQYFEILRDHENYWEVRQREDL